MVKIEGETFPGNIHIYLQMGETKELFETIA